MDSGPLYKAADLGESSDGEYEFIASSAARDRYGDIVVQDWNLADYRRNPIVLFAHDSARPVGTSSRIEVREKRLVARIKLADPGTSPDVDALRALVDQKIIRAVSVGFTSAKPELMRDEEGAATGYRFSGNTLLEISLVSVPANPQALAIARSLDISPEFSARLFAGSDPAPFLSRKRAQIALARGNSRINTKG